jgi:hypothetical protein
MGIPFNAVLSQANQPIVNKDGTPTHPVYAFYIKTLDMVVRALASGNIGVPAVNAVDDAAAAAAGVAIGQIYRNGSVLQVRVA